MVVLLHGGGQTRHSWTRTGRRLASHGWTAVALDARGHGDSAWDSAGDYSVDAFAGDAATFLRGLDSAPVVVGASLGGIVALLLAGETPDATRGLVLVDVVPHAEAKGVHRVHAFMVAHQDGFGSLEEVADAIAEYNPTRQRPRNLAGLRKNVRLRSDGRWYWHWDPAFMRIDTDPRQLVDPDRLRTAAAHVSVPTLLVRGLGSDVVGEAGAADLRRLIPSAVQAEVTGAGHMVANDDNDVFAAQLEAFLDGLI